MQQAFSKVAIMNQYSLVTQWHLEAPIDQIWECLVTPDKWPSWWRYVEEVVVIEKGDLQGLGSVRRFTWTSKLPYRLCFDVRTITLTKPVYIEGAASGDLKGVGLWQLRDSGCNTTHVQYTWTVSTEKSWMNLFAPILSPVFKWNHNQVMREGGRGLAKYLGVKLLDLQNSI
jgi:hypothetical protein